MPAVPVSVPRPRFVTTRVAMEYTRLSRWVLARAVKAGLLSPVGRRGKTLTWSLDELDRFMSGTDVGAVPAPAVAARRQPADQSAALERIKRVARHGKGA